jgi:hypothetical protein
MSVPSRNDLLSIAVPSAFIFWHVHPDRSMASLPDEERKPRITRITRINTNLQTGEDGGPPGRNLPLLFIHVIRVIRGFLSSVFICETIGRRAVKLLFWRLAYP